MGLGGTVVTRTGNSFCASIQWAHNLSLRAWVRHTSEVGILHFLADTCLNARCQTTVWPGRPGSSKGKISPLAVQRNIGPSVKFSGVGLTDLSRERTASRWPKKIHTAALLSVSRFLPQ